LKVLLKEKVQEETDIVSMVKQIRELKLLVENSNID